MATDVPAKCADSDFINVIQGVMDVIHHTNAAPTDGQPKKGVRRSTSMSELNKHKANLKTDMERLITSPHAQPINQPGLSLSPEAIRAFRALWKLLQGMMNAVPKETNNQASDLKTAVQRVVMSLDPTRPIFEEPTEMETG
jgi:hypothetical protein